MGNQIAKLNNKTKVYLIFCLISAFIFITYSETNEKDLEKIVDPILAAIAVGYLFYWIFNKLFNLKKNNQYLPKKNRKKNKLKKKELPIYMYVIFYPLTVFSFVILLGLIKSCGKV